MKILVDGLPRNIGGIGTLIINFVEFNRQIGQKDKYNFDFLVPSNSKYTSILDANNYTYYEVPKVYSHKYKIVLNDIFKKNNYDFIWINNTSKINMLLLKKAKSYGVKIIYHSHGIAMEQKGLKKNIFKIVEKMHYEKFCKMIDIPFACSKESANYFYPNWLLKNCKIISNGIDVDKYMFDKSKRCKLRNELKLNDTNILLGAVGRLAEVKNYEYLITLMTELNEKYQLVILGEGEERKKLENMIFNLKLQKRVKLLGKKENVEDYLNAFDIFLMPSFHEGMPFSLIEAQANGLKCIVSLNISKESNITGNVTYLSLSDKKTWLNEISKAIDERNSVHENQIIKDNGYSINTSYNFFISELEQYYDEN